LRPTPTPLSVFGRVNGGSGQRDAEADLTISPSSSSIIDKASKEDELRLALCASVLIRWHALSAFVPEGFSMVADFRIRKVKLARALEQADRALDEIGALAERPSEPPLLHLNAALPNLCVQEQLPVQLPLRER